MYPHNGIVISEADVNGVHSYCYDRGDGQFTRLVPVDILPFALAELPARENYDDGMIVLPIPTLPGPGGQPADIDLLPRLVGTNIVSQFPQVFASLIPPPIPSFLLPITCIGDKVATVTSQVESLAGLQGFWALEIRRKTSEE